MNNDWDKEFEQFKINFNDRKVYREEFNKWFWKLNWKEHDNIR